MKENTFLRSSGFFVGFADCFGGVFSEKGKKFNKIKEFHKIFIVLHGKICYNDKGGFIPCWDFVPKIFKK